MRVLLQVDSLTDQQLTLIVFDDDLGWDDDPVSIGFVSFGEMRYDVQVCGPHVPAQ